MSGGLPPSREPWWTHHLNLASLLYWLTDAQSTHIFGAPDPIEFLQKPWHWQPEWEAFLAQGGVEE